MLGLTYANGLLISEITAPTLEAIALIGAYKINPLKTVVMIFFANLISWWLGIYLI